MLTSVSILLLRRRAARHLIQITRTRQFTIPEVVILNLMRTQGDIQPTLDKVIRVSYLPV